MPDPDPKDDAPDDATLEAIRQRAHEIWEQEGRPEGRHEEHWRQAYQAVTGSPADGASPKRAARRSARQEQPVPGEPDLASGVAAAADQAGEAVPKPTTQAEIPKKPVGARALPKSRKPRG